MFCLFINAFCIKFVHVLLQLTVFTVFLNCLGICVLNKLKKYFALVYNCSLFLAVLLFPLSQWRIIKHSVRPQLQKPCTKFGHAPRLASKGAPRCADHQPDCQPNLFASPPTVIANRETPTATPDASYSNGTWHHKTPTSMPCNIHSWQSNNILSGLQPPPLLVHLCQHYLERHPWPLSTIRRLSTVRDG